MVFIYKKNVTEKSPKNCAIFSLSNLSAKGVLQSMTIKVNHNQCYKSYIVIAVIIADEFAHHSCIPIKLLSVIIICPFQGMQCAHKASTIFWPGLAQFCAGFWASLDER